MSLNEGRCSVPAQVIGIAADEFLRLEDAVRPVTLYPVGNRHVTDMLMLHLDNEKLIYNGDLYSVTEEPDEPPGNGLDLLNGIVRSPGIQALEPGRCAHLGAGRRRPPAGAHRLGISLRAGQGDVRDLGRPERDREVALADEAGGVIHS